LVFHPRPFFASLPPLRRRRPAQPGGHPCVILRPFRQSRSKWIEWARGFFRRQWNLFLEDVGISFSPHRVIYLPAPSLMTIVNPEVAMLHKPVNPSDSHNRATCERTGRKKRVFHPLSLKWELANCDLLGEVSGFCQPSPPLRRFIRFGLRASSDS
jgi:hypothetical protein